MAHRRPHPINKEVALFLCRELGIALEGQDPVATVGYMQGFINGANDDGYEYPNNALQEYRNGWVEGFNDGNQFRVEDEDNG